MKFIWSYNTYVLGNFTPIIRHRVKVIKDYALADFLDAHPVSDDSSLAIDLPDEGVITIFAPPLPKG